jgi:TusA-related sulfurtransferase
VDARGLSCPPPVILACSAIQAGGPIQGLVETATLRENVKHAAGKAGATVDGMVKLTMARSRAGGEV